MLAGAFFFRASKKPFKPGLQVPAFEKGANSFQQPKTLFQLFQRDKSSCTEKGTTSLQEAGIV
jgi:hypothetical protein